MDESAARDVLLVRAIEATDTEHALLSRTERDEATRTARELAHWHAAGAGSAPSSVASVDTLLAERARLLIGRLAERGEAGALRRAATALTWRHGIGFALPLAALLAGALFERLGDGGRINVLAFPLLALVLWNLAVYVALALGTLRQRLGSGTPTAGAGLRALLSRLALRTAPRAGGPLAAAVGRFVQDWTALSAPLTAARVARVLHMAAALFALGAIVGMYLRGLVFDYRAGWESTFLEPATVHALLAALLGPAANALGHAFPTVQGIEAIRFPASAGESAARWIHWYAVTVGVLVVAPRLLLAERAAIAARRLERDLPLDRSAPYFQRLTGALARAAAVVRVVPFSFTLDPPQVDGVHALARHLLGERADVRLQAAVRFGEEERAAAPPPDRADGASAAPALTLALCNLAATPEQENHGAFLRALAPAAAHALLVDIGPYRQRLGSQPGADQRLQERRAAWSAFARTRDWPIAFTDLAAPDLAQIEADLAPLLARA